MALTSLLPPALRRKLKSTREHVRILRESLSDARRHITWSTPIEGVFDAGDTGRALETQVTKDYHRIEKGLALPSPRQPFGAQVRRRLALGLTRRNELSENAYMSYASSAVAALDSWNDEGALSDEVAPRRRSSEVWNSEAFGDVERLFNTRRSIRNFDKQRHVDLDLVTKAVSMAINTPSVCNRQAWRVTFVTEQATVLQILKLQRGNTGFTETIPTVAIVTVDSRLFTGAGERNQRWVDGGLFAMSFVWALHSVGLATCMLNWSMSNAASTQMRRAAGLELSEDIISLIAVGHAPETYRVARSPRRDVSEVLRVISHLPDATPSREG